MTKSESPELRLIQKILFKVMKIQALDVHGYGESNFNLNLGVMPSNSLKGLMVGISLKGEQRSEPRS